MPHTLKKKKKKKWIHVVALSVKSAASICPVACLLQVPTVAVRVLNSIRLLSYRAYVALSKCLGVCVCCLRFYLGLPDWGLCSPKCPGHSWTHSNELAGIKWRKKNYMNKQIRLLTCQIKINFNWLDRGSKPVALSLQSTVALAKKLSRISFTYN